MKNLLKFITCGSVDDGKSTLIGHILYDTKRIYTDQEQALELDSKVGSRGGKIDYSLLLDGLMAEREQGITIDVAYRYFTTDERSFIVADTPGHEEYTRNMAVGASFADLAIILVDASQGVLVQTRRHTRICALMGIRYFVFALNKMDLVNYSRERFEEIQSQIEELAQELKLHSVQIIPVSATAGDNLTQPSENTPWYDGVPLLRYLETVDITESQTEEGFYLPVQRVCRPNHTFRGFQGQIESGEIHTGDTITVQPSGEQAKVKRILIGDRDAQSAVTGAPVTIQLDREIDVSRGCVLTRGNRIRSGKAFQATLLWMDDTPLSEGKEYFVRIGTKLLPGIVHRIRYQTDVNTGEQLAASSLSKNGIALCDISVDEEIPIDTFRSHKALGELLLIDRVTNMTSACGVVEAIVRQEDVERSVRFRKDDTEIKTHLFETFYFQIESGSIGSYDPEAVRYDIGDAIPLSGEGYAYPQNFDILSLSGNTAILIRDGRVADLIPIAQYEIGGMPIVNGRGFEIRAGSQEELEEFLTAYRDQSGEEQFSRWLRFETYRSVTFRCDSGKNYVI